MSTLNVESISHPTSGSNVTINGITPASTTSLGFRNLVINGAMQVSQRGTEENSVTAAGYYTCDRFRASLNALGTWTIQQSTESPAGFANSFRMVCTTADASPGANDLAWVTYRIEGFDCQRLFSAANTTHPMRLSFWVRSSNTGNASVEFFQSDNSGRQFTTSYNISTADTWEYKVIEIPVDTSAIMDNDSGLGLIINWWLNSGSSYTGGTHSSGWVAQDNTARNSTNLGVGGAVDDDFLITGVQLEVGSVATPFEHRSFDDELRRCQRYYQTSFPYGDAVAANSTYRVSYVGGQKGNNLRPVGYVPFNTKMRATPSVTVWNNHRDVTGSDNAMTWYNSTNDWQSATSFSASIDMTGFSFAPDSGGGSSYAFYFNWEASAEL